ncbi:MAG TPA: hypothetical protein VJL35_05285 [Gemmatimonadaceae bacterium]|jgi:hypothetical protein|nr:hypothetical protein [Gemmatimonadaceae bacterium]
MINVIQSLFGFGALLVIAAIVLWFAGRRVPARRLASMGIAALIIAGLLHIYLRISPV